MKFSFRYLKPIMGVFYIVTNYIFKVKYMCRHKNKFDPMRRFEACSRVFRKVSKSLDVVLFNEGIENIPSDQSCLIISNHLSDYDPFPLYEYLKKTPAFVGKKEIGKMPFISTFMKCCDGEFIDRSDIKGSLKLFRKIEEDFPSNIHHWIIYPEGTRNKDPLKNIQDFHHGSFKPAMRAGVPIYPIATYGTFRVFKNYPHYKKYPVFVKVLKPLMPEDYKDMSSSQVAKYVHDEIQKVVTFELRIRDREFMLKNNKNYIGD